VQGVYCLKRGIGFGFTYETQLVPLRTEAGHKHLEVLFGAAYKATVFGGNQDAHESAGCSARCPRSAAIVWDISKRS
jgi:hypothetical protein